MGVNRPSAPAGPAGPTTGSPGPGHPGQHGLAGQPGQPGHGGQHGHGGQAGQPGQPGQHGQPGHGGQHGQAGQLGQPGQPGQSQPGQQAQPAQTADPDGDQNRTPADQRRPRLGFLPGLLFDTGDIGAPDRATRAGRQLDPADPLAMFLFFLFPPDYAAEPARRPARQVAAPPEVLDLAPGLRVPPADHPQSALVDGAPAVAGRDPLQLPAGLGPDAEPVRALTDGHDPLGGLHERDWDRRFQVREADPEQSVQAEYAWPPSEAYPEGACAPDAVEPVVLEPGVVLDRFGEPTGRVLAADGTPYPQRSLPPEYQAHGYHRYRVEQPLPVWRAVSAAWFGQPGGGLRYRATHTVTDLVALGYLTEITATEESAQ